VQVIALEHTCKALPINGADTILRAEARALWALQQQGFVRAAYFRGDRKEAVLLVEAQSVDESQAMLNRLPLVQGEYIRFELIPLAPYDGFARLFEP
jgi:hypothetical protein